MKKLFLIIVFLASIISIIILALASFAFFIYVFGQGVKGPGDMLEWLKSTKILISLLFLSNLMFFTRIRENGKEFIIKLNKKIFD